jgi:hypothetical protein
VRRCRSQDQDAGAELREHHADDCVETVGRGRRVRRRTGLRTGPTSGLHLRAGAHCQAGGRVSRLVRRQVRLPARCHRAARSPTCHTVSGSKRRSARPSPRLPRKSYRTRGDG